MAFRKQYSIQVLFTNENYIQLYQTKTSILSALFYNDKYNMHPK